MRGRQKNVKAAAAEKKKAAGAERYNVTAGSISPTPKQTTGGAAAAAAAAPPAANAIANSSGGETPIKTKAATPETAPVSVPSKTKDALTPEPSGSVTSVERGSDELTPAQKEAQARLDFWNDDPSFSSDED